MRELVEYQDPVTGRVVMRYEDTSPQPEVKASDVFAAPQVAQIHGSEYIHGKGAKVCRQIPLHHPDAPRVDKMGRCVFTSQREEQDFMRKTGATNDGASLEANTEGIVDERKRMQQILPGEEEFKKARYEAKKQGILPRHKDEVPAEQARRRKQYKKRGSAK